MRETLLLDVPHRQVVFTIPKMLRIFFKFKRKLLSPAPPFPGDRGRSGRGGASPVLMNRKRFMSAGVFHQIPRMDDARLAEIFAREVLAFLVGKELVSSEWAERLLSWQHTGFSVHSLVRAKTKPEAERVGKYMIRLLLFLVSAVANDIIVGLMGITLAE